MGERRISDHLRLWPLVARRIAAAAWRPLRRFRRHLVWRFAPRFSRVELAPEDLRPADGDRAFDLMDGIFDLAGVAVDCRGRSPFAVVPPSAEWEAELLAFSWLRHLSAADDATAPERARVLLVEWSRYGSLRPASDRTDVVARRLAAFLREAPLLLARANSEQHDRYLAYLEDDARRLFERLGEDRDPGANIRHAAILAQVFLSVVGAEDRAARVLRRLDRDLAAFVLGDGVPADRNPATIVALLCELLPLRQVLTERGVAASRTLMGTLDRMLPMLRFFRHTDGALALFNGACHQDPELIAAVFLLDDARARPPGQALYGGYQRLEAGRAVLLLDTGPPPPAPLTMAAHAAPLAFEFSSGRNRFVVSTGNAPFLRSDWRQAVRETAAHSTVSAHDRSVGAFAARGLLHRLLGPVLTSRPWHVTVSRQEHGGQTAIVAGHDGYRARFGLQHERTIRLSPHGDRIDGRDRLYAADGRRAADVALALRFHIHPDVRLVRLPNGVIQLIAEDGEAWEFHVKGLAARLEPSVFLGDGGAPRENDQIVVPVRGAAEFRWAFLKSAEPRAMRRRALAQDPL